MNGILLHDVVIATHHPFPAIFILLCECVCRACRRWNTALWWLSIFSYFPFARSGTHITRHNSQFTAPPLSTTWPMNRSTRPHRVCIAHKAKAREKKCFDFRLFSLDFWFWFSPVWHFSHSKCAILATVTSALGARYRTHTNSAAVQSSVEMKSIYIQFITQSASWASNLPSSLMCHVGVCVRGRDTWTSTGTHCQ